MTTLRNIAFAAILSILCACGTTPTPEPVQPQVSSYLVRELDENGKTAREWKTDAYQHTFFPRKITFKDKDGNPVTLTKSFEVIPTTP